MPLAHIPPSATTQKTLGRVPWRRWLPLRAVPSRWRAKPLFATRRKRPGLRTAAHTAPTKLSDVERVRAVMVLRALCTWLDTQLNTPCSQRVNPDGSRSIVVFDTVVYTVDERARSLRRSLLTRGKPGKPQHAFEVGRPLREDDWIIVLAQYLGLLPQPAGKSEADNVRSYVLHAWITDRALRFLKRDPRYRALRARFIRDLIAIPNDVRAIALAARCYFYGPLLNARTLQAIWQNADMFRRVARENPQLLQLIFALERHRKYGPCPNGVDPVRRLKDALTANGLTEATWRYLTRHGGRMFQQMWSQGDESATYLDLAVDYLALMQYTGLPPPPPPSVFETFIEEFGFMRVFGINDGRFFEDFAPEVLRAGFLEADRLRKEGRVGEFGETLVLVLADHRQRRSQGDRSGTGMPWDWHFRRWIEEQAAKRRREQASARHWKTRLDAFVHDGVSVVPIRDSFTLEETAELMRNCLGDYRYECISGEMEIYFLSEVGTGRRRACAGFEFQKSGTVELVEVKGFANSEASAGARRAAMEVARRLRASQG